MQEIYALSTTTAASTNNSSTTTALTTTPTTSTITPTTSTTPTAATTPTTTAPTTTSTTLTPHILRKFGWGNMNSLYDIPKSKGIDIQHAACKFHKAYYLPYNSKLVLVSPQSIEESIQLVIESFSMWRAEPSSTSTLTTADTVSSTQDTILESASQPPPAKRSRKSNNNTTTTTTNSTSNTNNSTNTPTNSSVNLSFPLLTDILAPFEGKNPFLPESYSQITRVVSIKNTHKVYIYYAIRRYTYIL